MTCVAWDGKCIAADKRATCAGVQNTTTKIRRIATGEVLAWTGNEEACHLVARWYEDGADPTKWPDSQKDKEDLSRLIVASRDCVKVFERQPIGVRVEDKFAAWGSGRDFALAAMHLGKTAKEGVELASHFDVCCGNGVDVLTL